MFAESLCFDDRHVEMCGDNFRGNLHGPTEAETNDKCQSVSAISNAD